MLSQDRPMSHTSIKSYGYAGTLHKLLQCFQISRYDTDHVVLYENVALEVELLQGGFKL